MEKSKRLCFSIVINFPKDLSSWNFCFSQSLFGSYGKFGNRKVESSFLTYDDEVQISALHAPEGRMTCCELL